MLALGHGRRISAWRSWGAFTGFFSRPYLRRSLAGGESRLRVAFGLERPLRLSGERSQSARAAPLLEIASALAGEAAGLDVHQQVVALARPRVVEGGLQTAAR